MAGSLKERKKKKKKKKKTLTDAMGTRMLAITLGPELIALVTGPADPPPDGTSSARGP